MVTSSSRHHNLSYQLTPRYILDKLTKFGSIWLNLEKVISVQIQRGHFPSGLDRVKVAEHGFFCNLWSTYPLFTFTPKLLQLTSSKLAGYKISYGICKFCVQLWTMLTHISTESKKRMETVFSHLNQVTARTTLILESKKKSKLTLNQVICANHFCLAKK